LSNTSSFPYCIATIVSQKAINTMLETTGEGSYRDNTPWLVADDLFVASQQQQLMLPILFACKVNQGSKEQILFSHWSKIQNIEVVELHKGQWRSRCQFTPLQPINPIWESIDSLFLQASDNQMEREVREGVRVWRMALDEHHIHPYAICETPAFILESERR